MFCVWCVSIPDKPLHSVTGASLVRENLYILCQVCLYSVKTSISCVWCVPSLCKPLNYQSGVSGASLVLKNLFILCLV